MSLIMEKSHSFYARQLHSLLIVAVIISTAAGCSTADQAAKKNVMIIMLDGVNQGHLSFLGYERETTPNIAEIAERGVVLTSVIPSGCSTKASVTSLLTAIDYRYHQLLDHNSQLAGDFYTIAENFQDNGYITAAWGVSPIISKEMNYDQGFHFFYDHTYFNEGEWKYVRAHKVADKMLGFLDRYQEQEREEPFFIFTHFEEPHPPWFPETPWSETEEEYQTRPFDHGCTYVPSSEEFASLSDSTRYELRAKYDGALHQADAQIGRIINKLKEMDILKNTVIIFVTDHGYDLGVRYAFTHGYNPFDEVVKTAAIVFNGGHPVPIDNPDNQVRLLDIGPTAMGLAGVRPHENLEGLDIFQQSDELPIYAFVTGYGSTVVRSNKYKLIRIYHESDSDNQYVFQEGGPFEESGYFLFDLENDPGETVNLIESLPEIFTRMKAAMDVYLEDTTGEFIKGTTKPLSSESIEGLDDLGYLQ